MQYDTIDYDFIKRTLEIIEEYQGDNDVTLLINCCLGLLILPRERHFDSLPNKQITKNKDYWGLTYISVTTDCESRGYKLSNIIRRMRNGVCHFKIETKANINNNISGLIIKDNGGFKVEMSVTQLKEFVTQLAQYVLSKK